MVTRILPVEEWHRLENTEAETLWPHLDPLLATVVVVEDAEQILGCHVLMWVLHGECLWIHPQHRGRSSVARRLWAAVQREAMNQGARTLATSALSDEVRELLTHVGATQLPGDHYVLAMKES